MWTSLKSLQAALQGRIDSGQTQWPASVLSIEQQLRTPFEPKASTAACSSAAQKASNVMVAECMTHQNTKHTHWPSWARNRPQLHAMRGQDVQAVTLSQPQSHHQHEGVQDDPRSRLLWSIVGQATSTTWSTPALVIHSAQLDPQAPVAELESHAEPRPAHGRSVDAAAEDSRPPVCAAHPQQASSRDWIELPADLLASIAGQTQSPSAVLAFAGVCRYNLI